MWNEIKLLMVTAVITLLVWFYAAQLDTTQESAPVLLTVVPPPESDLYVRADEGFPIRVSVRLLGPNAAMRMLRSRLAGEPLAVRWPVPPETPTGRRRIRTTEILASHPLFDELGLRVIGAVPEMITIDVDRYLRHTVTVQPKVNAYRVLGEPSADPPRVQLRLLESQWRNRLADLQTIPLLLDPYLRNQPEGRPLEFDVPLPTLLEGLPVLPDPPHVRVRVVLKERTMERSLAPVVLKFAVSPELWESYRIELPDKGALTREVRVVGPEEIVARLEPQDLLGIIDVSLADARLQGEATIIRAAHIVLPPGVELVGDPPEVEFRLVPLK